MGSAQYQETAACPRWMDSGEHSRSRATDTPPPTNQPPARPGPEPGCGDTSSEE